MRKEETKTGFALICWILTVACMGVIFWLSSRTADESSQQSTAILDLLIGIFGDNVFTTFIVRKSAHFLEYTGLSFLFHLSFFATYGKPKYLYSVALTSLYAISDEVHQLFVEGRSCQISDWAIDTAGAILGALVFFVILLIRGRIRKNKKSPADVDRGNN